MQVLGIRFVAVTPDAQARAAFLDQLGIPRRVLPSEFQPADGSFVGAIHLAGASWVETWPPGPGMEPGVMLQVVVDDADAMAAKARAAGIEAAGPTDMHGERVYFCELPGGLQMSFQSALPA